MELRSNLDDLVRCRKLLRQGREHTGPVSPDYAAPDVDTDPVLADPEEVDGNRVAGGVSGVE